MGLGRGLSALISDKTVSEIGQGYIPDVPVDDIKQNPYQPRISINPESLVELSDSIREHGIIEPLIVTRRGDRYELIAGERRWRAAKIGLHLQQSRSRQVDRRCCEQGRKAPEHRPARPEDQEQDATLSRTASSSNQDHEQNHQRGRPAGRHQVEVTAEQETCARGIEHQDCHRQDRRPGSPGIKQQKSSGQDMYWQQDQRCAASGGSNA